MIFKVWKYELPPQDTTEIEIPAESKILSVQGQGNTLCLWALVNPDSEPKTRRFRVAGTGHPIEAVQWHGLPLNYIGTAQLHGGSIVVHVFERFD